MKKVYLAIFIFLMSVCLYADVTVNLFAYEGSFGVNLASKNYVMRNAGAQWVDYDKDTGKAQSDPNYYGTIHTVAHGGFFDMPDNIADDYIPEFTVTFESPTDFNYVNLANNVYQRPFKFQLYVNYNRTPGSQITSDIYTIDPEHAQQTVTWKPTGENKQEMKFDLLLVLEGEVHDNVLELNNRQYPLVEGDYSAVVTIRLTGEYKDKSNKIVKVNKSVTIPFSGYYADDGEITGDDTIGLSLFPTANAANLNIETMSNQQIPIATLDVLKHFGDTSPQGSPADHSRIFLSSSSNPFADKGEFALVHSSVPEGGTRTPANHVKYKIYAVSDTDRNAIAIFDGTATVDEIMASTNSLDYIAPVENFYPNISGINIHYHTYSGELYIEMEAPKTSMLPGMYRSTIYVHVVASDSF